MRKITPFKIKRREALIFLVFVFLGLYLGTIVYSSFKVESLSILKRVLENRIFILSLLAVFAVLFFLFVYNLFHVIRDRINRTEGSFLRFRLTMFFLLVTIIPIIPLIFFSNNVISKSIDLWFVSGIEEALVESVEMTKENIKEEQRDMLESFDKIKNGDLTDLSEIGINGIIGLKLGTGDVSIIYSDENFRENIQTINPFEYFLSIEKSIEQSGEAQTLVSLGDTQYIMAFQSEGESILFLFRALPQKFNRRINTITKGLQNYRVLKIIREPVKGIIVLIYFLVVLPFVLLSFYLSLLISKEVTEPIGELVLATNKVSENQLDYRLEVRAKDELKQLVDSFNRMVQELKYNREVIRQAERIAAWQDVARRIAHEIKNPLTPIKLSAERLLKKYACDDEYKKILEKGIKTIIHEVDTINNMVREFSRYARFPEAKLEKSDIVEIIKDLLDFLDGSYPEITFKFSSDRDKMYLLIDKNQIRMALLNCIYNSINAIENDGVVTLKIGESKRVGYGLISITDNGRGIDEEIQDKIFQPYFSKSGKGSGLGLAIVERIVIENRGRVWFESVPGRTTFYMEFQKA